MSILLDISKVLYLENSSIFSFVIEFIKKLDTNKLDNLYEEILSKVDEELYSYVFDLLTRVFFYISYKVNTVYPENCNFKVTKLNITNKKALIKIETKEL